MQDYIQKFVLIEKGTGRTSALMEKEELERVLGEKGFVGEIGLAVVKVVGRTETRVVWDEGISSDPTAESGS